MARDTILAALRAHQGDPAPPPDMPGPAVIPRAELVARFTTVLEHVGGTWAECPAGGHVAGIIRSHYPDAHRIVSTVAGPPGSTITLTTDSAPTDLVQVQLAIVRGRLGVAENAAVWVDDEQLPHRALPFVAEHVVILLAPDALVSDMHAAYEALAGRRFGYGTFVSGPSKTADIEQSLVMGAQGPRSLLVVLEQTV